QVVIDEIAQVNAGVTPLGDVGAVIRATVGADGHDLTNLNGPILAPGLGAQGARPENLRWRFGDSVVNVVPAYSRELLAAGPRAADLHPAAERARDACATSITVTP